MARFLGKDLSDEQIKAVLEHCSFGNLGKYACKAESKKYLSAFVLERMKKNPATNRENLQELGFLAKDGHFYRKGEIGLHE